MDRLGANGAIAVSERLRLQDRLEPILLQADELQFNLHERRLRRRESRVLSEKRSPLRHE